MNKRFEIVGAVNKGSFHFKGTHFAYHNHPYNATGMNERTVEIQLGFYYLEKYAGKRILEIGDVMSNYLISPVERDIVDKYETADNIIKMDILNYEPTEKYDLILSISTFEHIGNCEEEELSPTRSINAMNKAMSLLKPNGLFVCTWPLGMNYHLDTGVKDEKVKFDELYCFARESLGVNHWNFSTFITGYNTEEKGTQLSVKASDGETYQVGIYFFLCIGLKYGGTE